MNIRDLQSQKNDKLLKRILIIIVGLIIAAYGITLALYAGFVCKFTYLQ